MKIMLIGLVIVVSIIVIVLYMRNNYGQNNNINKTTIKEFPPRPKWKPNITIDYTKVENTFKYYFEKNDCDFVIFQNGTCVPVVRNLENQIQEAKSILDTLYNSHPDFNPLAMDDGNWLVSMSDKAFVICFKDEVEKEREYIDKNHLDGLATDEVLLNSENKPNTFDQRGKIGLFGRARWFLDAEFKKEIKLIKKGR